MDATRLTRVFSAALDMPPEEVMVAKRNSHPKWDSLAHARLVAAIESEFAIMLATEEIVMMDSFGVAAAIIATRPFQNQAKVIATDLDNTLWDGVVAEEGEIRITQWHQTYQELLLALQQRGTVLVAVSRNSPETIAKVMADSGSQMPLSESDFAAMVCGYGSKAAAIAELAKRMNLGLDSVVFVDDNPVEIAEVQTRLPMVECLHFGEATSAATMCRLVQRCYNPDVTDDDRQRTERYRKMLETVSAIHVASQTRDMDQFLLCLRQKLLIHDRSREDKTRAIQLLNKTNQFNLNGERIDEARLNAIVQRGGKVWTATLEDKNGSHGEILVCVQDTDSCIKYFAMSCRVFQRHVEYAFFCWLTKNLKWLLPLAYKETERNEPLRRFVAASPAFFAIGSMLFMDRDMLDSDFVGRASLIDVAEVN